MPVPPDDSTRSWVASWVERSKALEEVRKQELRALTEEEAGRLFAKMAFDPNTMWMSPERADSVGFIDQQRLFRRSHSVPHVIDAALKLSGCLEEIGLPNCFIAGIAVQRWGEPRLTVDTDATVITDWKHDERPVNTLLARFASHRSNARELAL